MKLTRAILFGWLWLTLAASGLAREYFAYFGTYTGKGSSGIYLSRFDSDTGKLTPPQLAVATTNPCFLAIAPKGNFLLAAADFRTDGKADSGVTTFAINPTNGALSAINSRAFGWRGVCHVSMDATGHWALAASYNSGAVGIVPLDESGKLGEISAQVEHHGSSVNTNRQTSPHAHQIITDPANRFAFVPDLGLDKVMCYRLDTTLTTNEVPFAKVSPGTGPRHLAFSPDGKHAYVLNEINSTLTAFSYEGDRGMLAEIQTVPTLPSGFTNWNTAAEIVIHPSGKFLYASNRGHDSIAAFAIAPDSGKLTFIEHQSTHGKTPRFIALAPDGKHLFALNQDSGNIITYGVDPESGKLKVSPGELKLASPVCLQFLPVSP